MDPQKLSIKSSDAWLDIEKGNYNSFTNLKNDNPNVKMIISLGGWVESNDNREAYNLVFNNDRARETFLQSLLAFLDEWKFDGLDLSFEFPQINERQGWFFSRFSFTISFLFIGFTTWVKSIKEAFGDRFELSASIPANTKKLQEGYEIQELNKYLDSFLVMAYDLHGPWESSADHHAPLFRRQWDTTYNYIDAT